MDPSTLPLVDGVTLGRLFPLPLNQFSRISKEAILMPVPRLIAKIIYIKCANAWH